jgi:hypothetical protein
MKTAALRRKPDDVKQRQIDTVATLEAALDPAVAAKRAALRYVHDSMAGITRHNARNGSTIVCPMARWCATSRR